MSQKRSISKLRSDDDDSSSSQSSNTSSRRRNRLILRLIHEEDISTFQSSNTPSCRRTSRSIGDLTDEEIYLLLGHQPLIILELDIKIHKVLFRIHFINSEYKTKWENRQHRLRLDEL